MGRIITIALRNIFENRRRSLILGTAIALVTVLLVLTSGLSRAMQATLLKSATTLVTGHVNVAGFYKVTASDAAPIVTNFEEIKQLVRDNVPELDFVIDRARGWGKIISDTSSQFASLGGVDITQEQGFTDVVEVKAGDVSKLAEPHTALIFETHAERLGVGVGDELTISAPTFRGVNNTVSVRIVAVAQDVGFLSGFIIYVPRATVRELYQLSDKTTGAIMVYLKDRRDVDKVKARLRGVLADAGYTLMPEDNVQFWRKFDSVRREDWTGQRIDVTSWEDEISFLSTTIRAFDFISGLLVSMLLVIIIVGIINTLWMAIRERTGEIGTLRAIGMQRRKVLAMFVWEAFLLSGMATVAGAVLGSILVAVLNAAEVGVSGAVQAFLMQDTLTLDVDIASVVRALFTITFVVTLGAIWPAWRAARLSPVIAMGRGG